MFVFNSISDLSVGLITVLSDLIWKITVNFYAGHVMCKIVKFAQVGRLISEFQV